MAWISDKKIFIILIVLFFAGRAWGFRISRPSTFQLPWTKEQINDLNNTLEELFEMQKGLFELDVVTTPKADPRDGEMWMIQTGQTVSIQYRGNNVTYTVKSYPE